MKMACIGVARMNGSFNNQPYDNFEFYFTDVEDTNRLAGVIPYTKNTRINDKRSVKALLVWKVKAAEWVDPHQPTDFVNKICKIVYDVYGNIAGVTLEG